MRDLQRVLNRGELNLTADLLKELLYFNDKIEVTDVEFDHSTNSVNISIASDEAIENATFPTVDGQRAICSYIECVQKKDKGQISDGSHTFDELYYHRMVLFAIICNQNKVNAWKSWKHSDGTMFDDYFIVGVSTSAGDYSYHYHKNFWDKFDVTELHNAPEWDGHKPSDIDRLFSLL
jgi:hypothetical protein